MDAVELEPLIKDVHARFFMVIMMGLHCIFISSSFLSLTLFVFFAGYLYQGILIYERAVYEGYEHPDIGTRGMFQMPRELDE
ncbi:unnamed protein product [Caenorhabditis brenneri]